MPLDPFENQPENSEKAVASSTAPPRSAVPRSDFPTSLKERITRLDAHIRFEFDLTAQRVGYLATSQAFLFSAYTFAIVNREKHELLNRVVYFVPRFGFVLSSIVMAAVVSAIWMTFILKRQRYALRDRLVAAEIDIDERVEHHSWQHYVGLLPPLTVTGGFTVGWPYVAGWIGCG